MTARRVLKKILVRTAGELIEALEHCLGSEVTNRKYVGKFVDAALKAPRFSIFPLVGDALKNGACHLLFERNCFPLTLTLRVAPGIADAVEVEKEFLRIRSPHPHLRVDFIGSSYEEFRHELRARHGPPRSD